MKEGDPGSNPPAISGQHNPEQLLEGDGPAFLISGSSITSPPWSIPRVAGEGIRDA